MPWSSRLFQLATDKRAGVTSDFVVIKRDGGRRLVAEGDRTTGGVDIDLQILTTLEVQQVADRHRVVANANFVDVAISTVAMTTTYIAASDSPVAGIPVATITSTGRESSVSTAARGEIGLSNKLIACALCRI